MDYPARDISNIGLTRHKMKTKNVVTSCAHEGQAVRVSYKTSTVLLIYSYSQVLVKKDKIYVKAKICIFKYVVIESGK